MEMTIGSLFCGIGGIDLCFIQAGYNTRKSELGRSANTPTYLAFGLI